MLQDTFRVNLLMNKKLTGIIIYRGEVYREKLRKVNKETLLASAWLLQFKRALCV